MGVPQFADQTMSSAEFRRKYASLVVPTIVTVNGHIIGTWVPGNDATFVIEHAAVGSDVPGHPRDNTIVSTPRTQQAERDAILRKINRGG